MQTVSCQAEGATTCAAGPITTTSGNLFIASTGFCCAAFTSVTDSKGNIYANSIADITDASTGKSRQDYKENGTGGSSHSFTLTGASSAFFGTMSVTEVSGAATSGALDQTATGTTVGDTSHTTASTATTAQAAELLLGFGSTTTPSTFTTDTGAGWTEQTNITTDVDTEGLITGTRIVAATGTFAYTFTSGPIGRDSSQGISTWKEASGNRQRCIGCGIDKKVIGE